MKATFKNIGPIKQAELELGDLTIIAGQNNTGKTYLAYTLYGFLDAFHGDIYTLIKGYENELMIFKNIYKIVDQMQQNGKASIKFKEFEVLANSILQDSSALFSSEFISEVFSAPNDEFEDAEFSIKEEMKQEEMEGQEYKINFPYRKSVALSFIEDGIIYLTFDNAKNHKLTNGTLAIELYTLFHKMIASNLPVPFILSAERFGVSLFYKELDFKKNELVAALQNLPNKKESSLFDFIEKESSRYSLPIKDNINFTRDLTEVQKSKGNLPMNNFRSVSRIMGGYYKTKNNEIRFISKKRGENRFDIPLHLASSSARGLSDLHFYLKHVAKRGQMLIIDEPESHLSPTNQVLIARLLAFCVNSGLKVLLTTHSDYLIKEFNNLIMLSNDFEGKDNFLTRNKKSYTDGDYLKPESVKAYTCEDGTLKACDVDKTGIDMPVFDDAIDKINKVSNELGLLTTDGD